MALAVRDRREERMDDPSLDPAIYRAVLGDLARVNRWTLAARPTLSFLKCTVGHLPSFRLLDVGFGQGDMLRRIARWADGRGIAADLVGVDLNPNSAAAALSATNDQARRATIDYRTGDYRDVDGRFDCVVSSLVAHHMTDAELHDFIRFMEARSGRGWMVNDLHRHRIAHLGYPVLARLIGAHPIVRQDGTLSIARAFRPGEWRAILSDVGIAEGAAQVVRHFPYRLCVERRF